METLKNLLFKYANTAREEIREYGERSAIGEAAAHNWQAYERLIDAAGLWGEFENKPDETPWDDREKSVTLTNAQWSRLTTYLLLSTKHREGERDAWKSLAEEKNEDGTPTFKNAAGNAAYWQEVIDDIETIRQVIDRI